MVTSLCTLQLQGAAGTALPTYAFSPSNGKKLQLHVNLVQDGSTTPCYLDGAPNGGNRHWQPVVRIGSTSYACALPSASTFFDQVIRCSDAVAAQLPTGTYTVSYTNNAPGYSPFSPVNFVIGTSAPPAATTTITYCPTPSACGKTLTTVGFWQTATISSTATVTQISSTAVTRFTGACTTSTSSTSSTSQQEFPTAALLDLIRQPHSKRQVQDPLACPNSEGTTFTSDDGSIWGIECGSRNQGPIIAQVAADSFRGCIYACSNTPTCQVANYFYDEGATGVKRGTCDLVTSPQSNALVERGVWMATLLVPGSSCSDSSPASALLGLYSAPATSVSSYAGYYTSSGLSTSSLCVTSPSTLPSSSSCSVSPSSSSSSSTDTTIIVSSGTSSTTFTVTTVSSSSSSNVLTDVVVASDTLSTAATVTDLAVASDTSSAATAVTNVAVASDALSAAAAVTDVAIASDISSAAAAVTDVTVVSDTSSAAAAVTDVAVASDTSTAATVANVAVASDTSSAAATVIDVATTSDTSSTAVTATDVSSSSNPLLPVFTSFTTSFIFDAYSFPAMNFPVPPSTLTDISSSSTDLSSSDTATSTAISTLQSTPTSSDIALALDTSSISAVSSAVSSMLPAPSTDTLSSASSFSASSSSVSSSLDSSSGASSSVSSSSASSSSGSSSGGSSGGYSSSSSSSGGSSSGASSSSSSPSGGSSLGGSSSSSSSSGGSSSGGSSSSGSSSGGSSSGGSSSASFSSTSSFTVSSSSASASATPVVAAMLSCPEHNGTIFTTSSGAQYIIECFVDRYDSDFMMVYTDSLNDCISNCSATASCVDVSWVPGSPGPCYMKKDVLQGNSNTNVWGARLLSFPIQHHRRRDLEVDVEQTGADKIDSAPQFYEIENPENPNDPLLVDLNDPAIRRVLEKGVAVTGLYNRVGRHNTIEKRLANPDHVSGGETEDFGGDDDDDDDDELLEEGDLEDELAGPIDGDEDDKPVGFRLCPAQNGAVYITKNNVSYWLECGVDRFGWLLPELDGPLEAPNLVQCIDMCDQYENCLSVTFKPRRLTGKEHGECWLKAVVGSITTGSFGNGARKLNYFNRDFDGDGVSDAPKTGDADSNNAVATISPAQFIALPKREQDTSSFAFPDVTYSVDQPGRTKVVVTTVTPTTTKVVAYKGVTTVTASTAAATTTVVKTVTQTWWLPGCSDSSKPVAAKHARIMELRA